MLAMRVGAVGAIIVGLGTIGFAGYSTYSALDLVDIGVQTEAIVMRSGKTHNTFVKYGGRLYPCDGGSYDVGTVVFVDPQRPWRCRSKEDLGGPSVFELSLFSVGFFLILAGIAAFVFEAFATDPELERFEM